MVAEDDPLVRFNEIFAIIMDLARCGPAVIHDQNPCRQPFRIKSIADGIGTKRGNQDVSRIQMLLPMQRQYHVSERAANSVRDPNQFPNKGLHWFGSTPA